MKQSDNGKPRAPEKGGVNRFYSKYIKPVIFCMMIIICVSFLIQLAALGGGYYDDVNLQAAEHAEDYALEQALYIKARFDALRSKTEFYASVLGSHGSENDAKSMLYTVHSDLLETDRENFRELLYFSGGRLYGVDGREVEGYPALSALAGAEGTVVTEAFQYENTLMSIAVSAPVENSYAERLVLVYARSAVSLADFAYDGQNRLTDSFASAEFVLLCGSDGVIAEKIVNSDAVDAGYEPVGYGLFRRLFTDAKTLDRLSAMTTGTERGSELVDADGKKYILTVNPFGAENGGMFLCGLYDAEKLYGDAYSLMNTIWGTLIMLGIIIIMLIVISALNNINSARKIKRATTFDEAVGCLTQAGFENEAEEILYRNRASHFAIVLLSANNFDYIAEKFGEGQSADTLRFIRSVCTNMTVLEEAVAYAGDGQFLLLLHYSDRKALIDRLSGLNTAISGYRGFPDSEYKLSLSCSIYEAERDGEKQSVRRMIDKVRMAKNNAMTTRGNFTFDFYGDMLRENYLRRAEIEGRMESALENNEFHLFYQPKYNLKKGGMDGSEILVRWFDAKIDKYRKPSEFLPIFEENGFINRLDRFVFYRACENIAQRTKNGQVIYPVSVNVSRATAIQPDFVSYYVRIKKKFGIRDGCVTLEFTESFAYENYEYLSGVISELHSAGFLCSLDDFGTGYSSFAVLKLLDFDEIKIDKSLLDRSSHPERDAILLQSIIDMIIKLGIKITQEGVEDRDEFEMLEKMGCDVIQGYFFAKPMKYIDYCEFVNTNFPKP